MNTREDGKLGEDRAVRFLEEQGILQESWDKKIAEWETGGLVSFLPNYAGSMDIEDF